MADEEENGFEESEDTDAEEGDGKSKKWLIILIVIIVLLGGGGVAAWKVVPALLSSDDKASGDEAGDKSGSKEEESKEESGPSVMYLLKPFIVNLLGGSGKRYLKLTIDLELSSKETQTELQSRMAPVQDSLLILLSSKTFDDVKTVEGKMRLKIEIISRINTQLKNGRVKNAYFTDFVVQ